MNKKQEKYLLSKAKAGDEGARLELIESLMHQVKYIATHYSRKGLPWDDLVQEGRIGLINGIDTLINTDKELTVRLFSFCKYRIRGQIRQALLEKSNTIYIPPYKTNEINLLKATNKLSEAIIQETSYDNPTEFKGGWLDLIWNPHEKDFNRMTLNETLLDILDDYLTLEEEDIIKLKFGFGHEYFDSPDWQRPNKPLTVAKIAEVMELSVKQVRLRLDSALTKLKTEEIQYKLTKWM